MKVTLRKSDADMKMDRFYSVMIVQTLFGEWSLVREWGRYGQGGTLRFRDFASQVEAHFAAEQLVIQKLRRGYSICRPV